MKLNKCKCGGVNYGFRPYADKSDIRKLELYCCDCQEPYPDPMVKFQKWYDNFDIEIPVWILEESGSMKEIHEKLLEFEKILTGEI